jgi:hypothetical protein
MRIVLTLIACIAILSVSAQTVNIKSVAPVEVKGRDKFDPSDDGVRTLKVTLELSGKRTADFKFALELVTVLAPLSKPKLVKSIIEIDAIAFPGRRKTKTVPYEVKIQLDTIGCMQNDETFIIKADGRPAAPTDPVITIKHFTTIPASTTIKLLEESTIINPLKEENENGLRSAALRVVISGPAPARDTPVKLEIPGYVDVPSKPRLIQNITSIIPRTSFSGNGCPISDTISVVIRLTATSKAGVEEKVPIVISNNLSTAHTLIIKTDAEKPAPKTEKEPQKKKTTFNYACKNGLNFSVLLKSDSSGNSIEVSEQDKKEFFEYTYGNYFFTTDFSRWLMNVFKTRVAPNYCDDCASCVSEFAEHVYVELQSRKMLSQKAASENNSAAKTDTAKGETKKTDTTKKDTAATAAASTAKTDTVIYKPNISYNDSLLFSLQLKKMKDLAQVKLCPQSSKNNSCDSVVVAGLSKEGFVRIVKQQLQKRLGVDEIDENKITPSLSSVYDKFQETIEKETAVPGRDINKEATDAVKATNPDEKTEALVAHTELVKDSLAVLYDSNGIKVKTVKIDSVKYTIEAGKIVRKLLRVYTPEGVFTNKKAPISIATIEDRSGDRLWHVYDNYYVFFGDVMTGESNGYVPDDIEDVLLTRAKPKKNLSAASNLNSLINFAFYTDLAALLGRKPNGLINTDISGRFITNTRNIYNRDWTLFSYIESNVVLAKFDSRFKSLDSNYVKIGKAGQKDTVDRMQLMQVAWLKGSMKFNLLSLRFFSHQYLHINIGARINIINADSFYRKETDIIYFDYYPEVLYSINRLKNFGMDISLKWLQQRIADREAFSNKRWESIFNPQIAFFFYPSANPTNSIYLRFNYFANRDKNAKNFYQFQFGWKTGLKIK